MRIGRAARHAGVENHADRNRHTVSRTHPARVAAGHVGRSAWEIDTVARPDIELVTALAKSVLQAHLFERRIDNELIHGLGCNHLPIGVIPNVDGLAPVHLQPDVVLPVDVKRRDRRRRRDEDEATDIEHAGLLLINQRSDAGRCLVQEFAIDGVRLNVVQRYPGSTFLDPAEHFFDGSTLGIHRVMVKGCGLLGAGLDEAALLGDRQFLRQFGEFRQLHQRMDRLNPVGRESPGIVDAHVQVFGRDHCFPSAQRAWREASMVAA